MIREKKNRISSAASPSASFASPRFARQRWDVKGLCAAFSLIEIMVTVGLLSLIILGLMYMFNQTQRAFRTSMTQSDVLEAGRATMDLVTREVSQMTPCGAPNLLINGLLFRPTNFFCEPSPWFAGHAPLEQGLPSSVPSNIVRTNTVQRFFFLTRLNQDWIGTGYDVIPDNAGDPLVGTLWRFSATNRTRTGPITLSGMFVAAAQEAALNSASGLPVTNLTMNRIADGVVHLRVRTYASNGFLLVTNGFEGTNWFAMAPYDYTLHTNMGNAIICGDPLRTDQSAAYFMSNAAPAYVDVELGILEPQVLQKYRSIPVQLVADSPQRQYLSNHVAQVHLFHQRIAIPNVDTTAYPQLSIANP